MVQPLGLGRKMRYLNRLIISYEKEKSNCKSKTKKIEKYNRAPNTKSTNQAYCAYHKAAKSKERGKKKKAKNTVKQKIMLLSLLMEPLEE